LINRCRPTSQPDCDPPWTAAPNSACLEGVERWVLAICYDEQPSRGVTALRGEDDTACCTRCSCGGSGACGCGGAKGCSCGQHAAGPSPTPTPTRPTRQYKPQCEPTLICEGYRFTAYRAPKTAEQSRYSPIGYTVAGLAGANFQRLGPLLTRVLGCLLRLHQIVQDFQDQKATNNEEAAAAFADALEALRDFAAEHVGHRCDLIRLLSCLEEEVVSSSHGLKHLSPDRAGAELTPASALTRLQAIAEQLLLDCFCSVLLPPSPDPGGKDCVPLAVVTVRRSDCRVITVCNWEERKFAVTLPNLFYWTSWLPWQTLQDGFARLCCGPVGERWVRLLIAPLAAIASA